MTEAVLRRVQSAIARGEYDLTFHAVEEMAEDGLDVLDLEAAVSDGDLIRIQSDDPRGPRLTVVGYAMDRVTRVGVVGRFTETGVFLVVTVFGVAGREE